MNDWEESESWHEDTIGKNLKVGMRIFAYAPRSSACMEI